MVRPKPYKLWKTRKKSGEIKGFPFISLMIKNKLMTWFIDPTLFVSMAVK